MFVVFLVSGTDYSQMESANESKMEGGTVMPQQASQCGICSRMELLSQAYQRLRRGTESHDRMKITTNPVYNTHSSFILPFRIIVAHSFHIPLFGFFEPHIQQL